MIDSPMQLAAPMQITGLVAQKNAQGRQETRARGTRTLEPLHVTVREGRRQGSSAQKRGGVTQVRGVSEVREESGKVQGETNQRQ